MTVNSSHKLQGAWYKDGQTLFCLADRARNVAHLPSEMLGYCPSTQNGHVLNWRFNFNLSQSHYNTPSVGRLQSTHTYHNKNTMFATTQRITNMFVLSLRRTPFAAGSLMPHNQLTSYEQLAFHGASLASFVRQ